MKHTPSDLQATLGAPSEEPSTGYSPSAKQPS